MSLGLIALVAARGPALVFVAVVPLGAGMAAVGPSLTAQVSRHATTRIGAALSLQQAVQGMGQVAGALLGTLLFYGHPSAPYLSAAALLAGVGLAMARWSTSSATTDERDVSP